MKSVNVLLFLIIFITGNDAATVVLKKMTITGLNFIDTAMLNDATTM